MAKPKLTTAVKDLTINQGDDFRFQLKIKNHDNSPVNITGYQYQCKVRRTAEDDEVILAAEVEIIDATGGIVEFHFKDEDTSQIDTDGDTYATTNTYTYDVLQKTPDGEATRLLNGALYVSPGISWH